MAFVSVTRFGIEIGKKDSLGRADRGGSEWLSKFINRPISRCDGRSKSTIYVSYIGSRPPKYPNCVQGVGIGHHAPTRDQPV